MMMIPRRNEFDLFEDMFRDPFFEHETKIMRSDIRDEDGKYLIDIDLPGYEKDNIKIEIENGYLTVQASMNSEKEEKKKGKFVRRERYEGTCSRSFYIGDDIKSEEIKANFKNGILTLAIPKKEEQEELPEKKYIQIDS